MAAWNCGWCGKFGTMNPHNYVMLIRDEQLRTTRKVHGIYSCAGCYGLSIGSTMQNAEAAPGWKSVGSDYWLNKTVGAWEPKHAEGQDFPDVPPRIATAASEAHKSNSIGNHMSAILMARTVIEATAKNKGVVKGTLFQKIDEMRTQGLIREDTQEAAHEIRDYGNDMAHGDIDVPVAGEDAAEILTLMDEILNEVFQGPARTARLKELRQARNATES